MMRISKNAIVSFPNFGYIRTRTELMVKGTMPKNVLLPYEWYETPNIHLLTIKDFQDFCREKGYPVKQEHHFSVSSKGGSRRIRLFYNFLAQYGFFVLDGERYTVLNS
jgi:methionine biosynthesis protein MetW